MIAFLLPLVLKLGVPQRIAEPVAKVALVIAGAALLLGGFMLWLHFHDKSVVRADRAEANVEALQNARQADERAERAAESKSEEVSDANERARAAADAGSDPLGDGLRSLRAETDGGDQATRGAD